MKKIALFLMVTLVLVSITVSCDKTFENTSKPPVINSFTPSFAGSTVDPDKVIQVTVNFTDPDVKGTLNPTEFTFQWSASVIEPASVDFDPSDNFVVRDKQTCYWHTPDVLGFYSLSVVIVDKFDNSVSGDFTIQVSENKSPIITNVEVSNSMPLKSEVVTITITADDPDGNLPLNYSWSASTGYFSREADNVVDWVSAVTGNATITVRVYDSLGAYIEKQITISVQGNSDPVIDGYDVDTTRPAIGQEVNITIQAHDPDGDELSYTWSANGGSYQIINGASATWIAPMTPGNYSVSVKVSDGKGGEDDISIPLEVIQS